MLLHVFRGDSDAIGMCCAVHAKRQKRGEDEQRQKTQQREQSLAHHHGPHAVADSEKV